MLREREVGRLVLVSAVLASLIEPRVLLGPFLLKVLLLLRNRLVVVTIPSTSCALHALPQRWPTVEHAASFKII